MLPCVIDWTDGWTRHTPLHFTLSFPADFQFHSTIPLRNQHPNTYLKMQSGSPSPPLSLYLTIMVHSKPVDALYGPLIHGYLLETLLVGCSMLSAVQLASSALPLPLPSSMPLHSIYYLPSPATAKFERCLFSISLHSSLRWQIHTSRFKHSDNRDVAWNFQNTSKLSEFNSGQNSPHFISFHTHSYTIPYRLAPHRILLHASCPLSYTSLCDITQTNRNSLIHTTPLLTSMPPWSWSHVCYSSLCGITLMDGNMSFEHCPPAYDFVSSPVASSFSYVALDSRQQQCQHSRTMTPLSLFTPLDLHHTEGKSLKYSTVPL